MSDYVKKKVLRVPITEKELCVKDFDELEKLFPILFDWKKDTRKFEIAPTIKKFLDFVLEYEYGADCGEYGKVRELRLSEQVRFRPLFAEVFPTVVMDNVRVVEYCWYNCSEAPDYYANENDKFYDEVF